MFRAKIRRDAMRLLHPLTKSPRPDGSTVLVDFFIVGAMRSGTSSLRDSLAAHPSITMAYGEPHFFSHHYDKGIEYYHQQFDWSRRYLLRGEKSPPYAVKPGIPERIAQYNPRAKILWILRDPVERAVSHFQYAKMRDAGAPSISEAIRHHKELDMHGSPLAYVSRSEYHKHLQVWASVFSPEQQHVAIFEEVAHGPGMGHIQDFLGVPRTVSFDNTTSAWRYQKTKAGNPASPDDIKNLKEVLAPTVEAMEGYLGRPIPSWR